MATKQIFNTSKRRCVASVSAEGLQPLPLGSRHTPGEAYESACVPRHPQFSHGLSRPHQGVDFYCAEIRHDDVIDPTLKERIFPERPK